MDTLNKDNQKTVCKKKKYACFDGFAIQSGILSAANARILSPKPDAAMPLDPGDA